MNRNLLIQHPENYPVKITHTKQGSFSFTMGSNNINTLFFTCHIDWGDGTPPEYKEFNTYGTASHTYNDVGTKTIIIRRLNPQKVERFSINTSGDIIKSFEIDCLINLKKINFYNCRGAAIFASGIPKNLLWDFKNLTDVTDLFKEFAYTQFNTIPEELFIYNPNLSLVNNAFNGMTRLSTIPENLFINNNNITSFRNCFVDTKIDSVPANLFKFNTAVTHFSGTFYYCSSLTTLPATLFQYNTVVTNFSQTFYGCSALTTLPTDLFKYNTAVTDFTYTFSGCTSLTTLPTDLFRYNTAVTNFSYTFYGCSALTSLPTDLFRYNTAVTDFGSTFGYCSKISGEINMPEARSCTSIDSFARNTKITKINFPENFGADVAAGVSMMNYISDCVNYDNPVSINFKVKAFSITATSNVPVPSIRLLNQNSTFTGSTPQVNISGCKSMSVEAYNQLLSDLPSGLSSKTIKLPTICQTNGTDTSIGLNKNWSVIFG